MISGTNPALAKLYNWLARNRASVGYGVSQTVNPVVDVADLWPKTPVIRASQAVLPIGGISKITIWDGGVDGGASGGPYHCMIHRTSIGVTVKAVAITGVLTLTEPDTNNTIVLYQNAALALFDTQFDNGDIYVPPRWSMSMDFYGTLGDTVSLTCMMTIANATEPLPRGI